MVVYPVDSVNHLLINLGLTDEILIYVSFKVHVSAVIL